MPSRRDRARFYALAQGIDCCELAVDAEKKALPAFKELKTLHEDLLAESDDDKRLIAALLGTIEKYQQE